MKNAKTQLEIAKKEKIERFVNTLKEKKTVSIKPTPSLKSSDALKLFGF